MDPILRAVLESLDQLPEKLTINPRELYRRGEGEHDGLYVFGPEGFEADGFGVANPTKLNTSLAAARKDHRTATRKAEQLERELAAARARVAELEEAAEAGGPAPDADALRARIEADLNRKHEAAMAAKVAELEQLGARGDGYRKQALALLTDSATAGGSKLFDYVGKQVQPHLASRVRIEEDEDSGQLVRHYLNANGEPGIKPNGQPWDLEDVVLDLSKDPDLGGLFVPRQGQPPAGAQPSRHASKPSTPGARQRVLTHDEINDFATYNKIAEQAARDGVTLVPPAT